MDNGTVDCAAYIQERLRRVFRTFNLKCPDLSLLADTMGRHGIAIRFSANERLEMSAIQSGDEGKESRRCRSGESVGSRRKDDQPQRHREHGELSVAQGPSLPSRRHELPGWQQRTACVGVTNCFREAVNCSLGSQQLLPWESRTAWPGAADCWPGAANCVRSSNELLPRGS